MLDAKWTCCILKIKCTTILVLQKMLLERETVSNSFVDENLWSPTTTTESSGYFWRWKVSDLHWKPGMCKMKRKGESTVPCSAHEHLVRHKTPYIYKLCSVCWGVHLCVRFWISKSGWTALEKSETDDSGFVEAGEWWHLQLQLQEKANYRGPWPWLLWFVNMLSLNFILSCHLKILV